MEDIITHLLSGGGGAAVVLVLVWERIRRMQKDLEAMHNKIMTLEGKPYEKTIARIETHQEHTNKTLSEIKRNIDKLFDLVNKK